MHGICPICNLSAKVQSFYQLSLIGFQFLTCNEHYDIGKAVAQFTFFDKLTLNSLQVSFEEQCHPLQTTVVPLFFIALATLRLLGAAISIGSVWQNEGTI